MGVVGGGGGFSFTLWGVGGLVVVVTYLFVICFFLSLFLCCKVCLSFGFWCFYTTTTTTRWWYYLPQLIDAREVEEYYYYYYILVGSTPSRNQGGFGEY